MRFIIGFALLGFSSASAGNLEVQQVDQIDKRVVLREAGPQTEPVKKYIISLSRNKQCTGRFVSKKDQLILVDLSECSSFEDLRRGQKAQPVAEFNEPENSSQEPPAQEDFFPMVPPRREGFFGQIALQTATRATFTNVSAVSGTDSLNGEVVYTGAGGIGFKGGYMTFNRNSWNYRFEGGLDMSRSLDDVEISGWGGTLKGSVSGKISTAFVLAGGLYHFEQFYLGGSLGFASISHENMPPAWSGMTGGMAAQLSVGFFPSDRIFLEFASRSIALTSTPYSSGATVVSLGTGSLSIGSFQLGYIF